MEYEINENKFSKLFNDAVDTLDALMKDKSDEELNNREILKYKSAATIINSYPRYRQSQASIASVTLSVLRGAAVNDDEYRELIRNHMPRVNFLRTIPEALTMNRKNAADLENKIKETTSNAIQVESDLKAENIELKARIQELENR
jgi:hypothetical protein